LKLRFLGAAGTVTGSKYLLEAGDTRLLVDCGLYQGVKQLRLRNWKPLPVESTCIDAVLLTHAHVGHSGYLPALVRDGFSGRVFCSEPTRELFTILLPDAGHLAPAWAGVGRRAYADAYRPWKRGQTEAPWPSRSCSSSATRASSP